ncbi:MAG: DUF86 domain-containing protein [Deltaproteobacteria bacterium]|nr:DUF86 domain-containing protein [Deltaproteobacteria bacterium]MBW2127230.1 DUF86 domain-containing protein [Deltaproteobacteria bacterium]
MSRDYLLFFDDIRLSCEKIVRYTSGLTFEQFIADEKTFDAVLRNLIVIGEAVKHLPKEVRDRNPQVEWREIAGFRDIAVHEYFGIDEDIVWDIVKNEVPSLLAKLSKIIEHEEKGK